MKFGSMVLTLLVIGAIGASVTASASDDVARVSFTSSSESASSRVAMATDKSGTDVVETRTGTLYYNKASGRGMIAGVNADGFPTFRVDYDFGAGWERIASVGDSLFFYAADGRAAVGYIDSDEQYVQSRTYPAGSFPNFSKAVASLDSNVKLR